jgi:Fic family protein
MLTPSYSIPLLPPAADLETRAILRAVADAHKYLGEVKGRAASIPNQGILIDTLFLQEAKASSDSNSKPCRLVNFTGEPGFQFLVAALI